jgi:hypothetical protein
MNTLAALILLVLAPPTAKNEGKYEFTIDSQKAGTATMSLKASTDGSVELTLDLSEDLAGQTLHQVQRLSFDKDGKPLLASSVIEAGTDKKELKIVFGIVSLTETATENGKSTSQLIRYPLGRDMKQPSLLWFVATRPTTGQASYETVFDQKSLKFHRHKRSNLGPTNVDVAGKKTRCFELVDEDIDDGSTITQWVDVKGMPYRMIFQAPNQTAGQTMEFDRVTN